MKKWCALTCVIYNPEIYPASEQIRFPEQVAAVTDPGKGEPA